MSSGGTVFPCVVIPIHLLPGRVPMPVEVRVPTILRGLTGEAKTVTAEGQSIAEVIAHLDTSYPGMGERLLDDSGLRRFVNIYLNDEDIRFLEGLKTPVSDHDSITILPAVAGG